MDVDPRYRPQLRAAAVWLGVALASVALVAVPAFHFKLAPQWNVALHTLLETVSIVVAALVFSSGAIRVAPVRSDSIAPASTAFLAVAILDFVHVLAYEGMPAFVTPSGSGKAIAFFLAARLIAALGVIVIALPASAGTPAWGRAFGAGALGFAAAVVFVGFDPQTKSLFFVPGQGLTAFKVASEFVLVLLDLFAAGLLLARMRTPQPFMVVHFFAAAVLMAVSEFCFTLYATTTDQFNVLGHFWKVVAYLFVYRAVVVDVIEHPYVELEQAHTELDAANASLEQRVHDRTAQLEAAYHDLEAFSSSVAHDLRAPVHAISGFAGALQARACERLTADERRYLERIHANSIAMNEMIDALLALARLSRSSAQRNPVELAALAEEVVENLRRAHPDRHVEVAIHRGEPVTGDAALLRTALQNLLGNAWKFTLRRNPARIELGEMEAGGERVFYVRDNGEGFEMAHAPNLFALFQRLHTDPAFPGHGIGLVNVQRIVTLHGGRIWAEGEPDAGATFYFTLPARAETQASQAYAASL